MKVAIIGAGFTGLSCALKLLEQGHKVTVFEKEDKVGGLAAGFKQPGWDWYADKSYHHFFTSDKLSINLTHKLGLQVVTARPKTNVLVGGAISSLDSPSTLLSFPYLSLLSRLRLGFILFYLRYLSNLSHLKDRKALPWIRKYMGKKVTKMVWEPLFAGKFGTFAEDISLTWFWARIKKRGTYLAYPEGGFQEVLNKLAEQIGHLDCQIRLNTEVISIKSFEQEFVILSLAEGGRRISDECQKLASARDPSSKTPQDDTSCYFDKVIVTTPTPVFTKITPDLPKSYVNRISSIPHLTALNLILVLPKRFLKNTYVSPKAKGKVLQAIAKIFHSGREAGPYWLNITDQSFPFLVMAEHTNFMDSKHYGGKHILYIGNYLPPDHPYLKMTAQQLLKVYAPFLKKISPNYTLNPIHYYLFKDPNAQPVVTTNYLKFIPEFKTPLPNIYLANLDMVYPWDRGVNYAIELGEKAARRLIV